MSKLEPRLSTSKDWDAWISVVHSKATDYMVWDLIDPNITPKPANQVRPTAPRLTIPDGASAEAQDKFEKQHRSRSKQYTQDYQIWKEEHEGLVKVKDFIHSSITAPNQAYIQKTTPHPWDFLCVLKERLAPSDAARLFDLRYEYSKIKKGPSNRQSIHTWLDDWSRICSLGKEVGVPEVNYPRVLFSDFCVAVQKYAPTIITLYEEKALETGEGQIEALLSTLIERFRQHVRTYDSKAHSASHSAFATEGGEESDAKAKTPTLKGKTKEIPECLCGSKHYWSNCDYLRSDRPGKPNGFKPDAATKKKVEDSLNKDTDLKARVAKAIENARRREKEKKGGSGNKESKSATPQTEEKLPYDGNFAVHGITFTAGTHPLRGSWIVDHGSDCHVCNSTMADRFIMDKKCEEKLSLRAGNDGDINPIVGWGRVDVQVSTPKGKAYITLHNVVYVPTFQVNLVGGKLLKNKGVFFDNHVVYLFRVNEMGDRETAYHVREYGSHYLLEDNTGPIPKAFIPAPVAFATSNPTNENPPTALAVSKVGTTNDWHQLLAHAGNDAIQHLATAAEGVEVTDSNRVPKTNECETCALAKAHRIVSRSPAKSERSDKPFYRITYDLIDEYPALNKDSWVSHIACSEKDFHLVFTHRYKSEATEVLRKAINIIQTRFDGKVVFIRSDTERSLGNSFQDLIKELGITWEPSAPDTPAQNGHSERKGGILMMKARAMIIDAKLPGYLWPWVVQAAGYLMNRTPMAKHQWKTSFEVVTGYRPNLKHLRVYGCKAYSLNKSIPRRDKLAPRAHLGFLVGYESTNIFNIWIPSLRKVVRNRDVMLDEQQFYKPGEVDEAQLVKEPFLDSSLNIPASDLSHMRITDIDSDSDTDEDEPRKDSASTDPKTPVPSSSGKGKEKEQSGFLTPSTSRDSSSDDNTTPLGKLNQQVENIVREGQDVLSQTSQSSQTSDEDDDYFDAFDYLYSQPPPDTPIPPPKARRAPKPPDPYNRSDFNEDNILSDTVTRRREKKKAYAIILDEASGGGLQSYHTAFAAFLPARMYYEREITPTATAFATTTSETRLHRDHLPPEPKYYHQMLKHPHADGFIRAMDIEIKALRGKKTWEEVSFEHAIKANKKPIPTTWVFKYKFDDNGFLTKYKARLCARGDQQYTAQNTYAATLASRIFRIMMALVAIWNLETRQFDAVNAFANSKIDEPTYLKTPEGWKGSPVLLLLLQALYGLKQSPALWFRHLSKTLSKLGLEQVTDVECLFVNKFMILFFFVDDIAIIYDRKYSAEVDDFQSKLLEVYEMRFLGEVQWFLGVRVVRDRKNRQLCLMQDSYIDKITTKFNTNLSSRPVRSPMDHTEILVKNAGQATAQEIHAYQQVVGSINFSATVTRPDIAFACSKLSEFLTNPSEQHQKAADRVMRYLGHTRNYAIVFDAQMTDPRTAFIASSDAAYADIPETRYSSQGYGFKLFNGMVDWKATKQKTVTTSSTEAELHAISATAKEQLWWTRFFEEIDLNIGHDIQIECDNMQTIRILTSDNAQFTTKLRHVDVHRHWLRQEIRAGKIHVKWKSTTTILADGLTKALSPQRHQEFVAIIGLETGSLQGVIRFNSNNDSN